jgi:hypothetical protein
MENSKFEVLYSVMKNLWTAHLWTLSSEDIGNNSWWENTTEKTDWEYGVST